MTNNGRCVAVGATSGGGGNSTGLSMTAGAATSKTGSGAVVRVARQSVDGGEPAGTPKVPRSPRAGDGAGVTVRISNQMRAWFNGPWRLGERAWSRVGLVLGGCLAELESPHFSGQVSHYAAFAS